MAKFDDSHGIGPEEPQGNQVSEFRAGCPRSPTLAQLALTFLRLGIFAFGGPAAHIAMMEDEIIQRRQWVSYEQFLDLMGVTNLLPGPNSTEMAIHLGFSIAGWRGLWVSGAAFITPAAFLVWGLAVLYVHYQLTPQAQWLLYGIKPVVVVIIVQALWKLGKKALKDPLTVSVGLLAFLIAFFGGNEVAILLLLGGLTMLLKNRQRLSSWFGTVLFPLAIAAQPPQIEAQEPLTVSGWLIFQFFFKVGCVLYGSGYVLVAFLQQDLVERQGWLTSQQLLDAVAIGQMTPGPVLTTATFVGYLLAGSPGAFAGTLGIFLPAFLLVGLVNPWIPKLRQSQWASAFLDGVNAASLGLMGTVTLILAQSAFLDLYTVLVTLLSAILLFRFRWSAAWLVLLGGVAGIMYRGSLLLL